MLFFIQGYKVLLSAILIYFNAKYLFKTFASIIVEKWAGMVIKGDVKYGDDGSIERQFYQTPYLCSRLVELLHINTC